MVLRTKLRSRARRTTQWYREPARNRIVALALLTAFPLVGVGLQSQAGAAPSLVLNGQGLSIAHLGDRQSTVETTLRQMLGKPTIPLTSTPQLHNCGVSAMSSWHAFSLYFNHERLVGVSLGPGTKPVGQTSTGLKLGNTLRRARSIYGNALHTSTSQGGSWTVTTNNGPLDGFLIPSTRSVAGPTSRIQTIDVGVVGCPAMSP